MKYYLLSNATDEKEIGKTYPQCKGVPNGYTFAWYDEPDSMTNLINKEFPKNNPNLIFELEEKAILTDVVSPSNISARGILMNERALNIINKKKILNNEIYSGELKKGNEKFKYYWLHLVHDNFDNIDFINSNFIETNLFRHKVSDLKIENEYQFKIEFEKCLKRSNIISVERLKLKTTFNYDLFFFPKIHSDLIVSEVLLNKLESENITGITSKPADFLN
jgi:hypothetical protein